MEETHSALTPIQTFEDRILRILYRADTAGPELIRLYNDSRKIQRDFFIHGLRKVLASHTIPSIPLGVAIDVVTALDIAQADTEIELLLQRRGNMPEVREALERFKTVQRSRQMSRLPRESVRIKLNPAD